MKKFLPPIIAILFAVVVFTTALFFDLFHYAGKPAATVGKNRVLVINKGQRFKTIAQALGQAGFIKSPIKFYLLARLKGDDKKIKAGEYLFSAVMSPQKILARLVSGEVKLHRLTIPEGYNLSQVAAQAQKAGLVDAAAFLKAARDAAETKVYDIPAATFEGYLYPDTYFFGRPVTAKKIVATFVNRFNMVFTPAWRERAKQLNLTVHEVVTLASIIEKETGAAFERPIISSVFHNRLKKRMRLESDPTVIYGIKNFDGNITRRHLKTPTPYNTYTIKGLPPGPIANPGRASLHAALFPKDTDYLFFVSKNDTTHKFTTHLEAHRKAVRKYQLRR